MGARLKRIYDLPEEDDGYRVLVDRLWPRGISKANAQLDDWLKELAPSNELRREFHARPEKYDEFRAAYTAELSEHAEALEELRARVAAGTVTILYAAKDAEHNNARVLCEVLDVDPK
ncbi:DUF488 domain-containing protein [Cumulibacter soli]|uniref:DUF488 domain-containing protein n=1 Tax=Cumulibacter soli TaxID=2546344 RepID=UPI0010679F42|nr:DUF488 family protein [Cumulibacter soli]